MKTVAFHTLGCKVNQYETEAMIEAFELAGYKIGEYEEYSDIYIVNTCTVTNMGDKKSRQIIRRALDLNPNAFIAVVGCYSQIAPDKVLNIDGVGLVLGTSERARIVELVEYSIDMKDKVNMVSDIMKVKDFEDMKIENYKGKTRAFIKIQEGCDQYCTYCIIPYARGHIRSRKLESIMREVGKIVESGFKEVVLTGIHVGSYGKDIGGVSLVDVIEMIHKVDGIERIRMSSVEPKTLTDDFIERLKVLPKTCKHFHLSLQSGCDETLKRMNRKYTTVQYKTVVDKLRNAFPEVAITTDLIVGFPGETEEEFEETLQFIKKIKFSHMHIFKFSPKEGTPAAKYPNQVNPRIKDERSKIITELAGKIAKEFKSDFIGKSLEVLYEHKSDEKSNSFEGLTDNYIKVISESAYDIKGKIIKTSLIKVKDEHILGII